MSSATGIGVVRGAGRADLGLADDAAQAEEEGFVALHTAEATSDPYLPHALTCEKTSKIKLGTSVAVAFGRSPYVTANVAWDIHRLSGGRFEVGLGPQVRRHVEDRLSGEWHPPGPRLRDYVKCMQSIFHTWQSGDLPTYEGRFYKFTWNNPHFNAGPLDFDPPKIFISCVNDYMTRLAGEICDGVLLHPLATPHFMREFTIPRLEAGAKKASRRLDDFVTTGASFVGLGRTTEELKAAREGIRGILGFYGSTPAYRTIFEMHDWGHIADGLRKLSLDGNWGELASHVSDEVVDAMAIICEPGELVDSIRSRWEGLVDRFSPMTMLTAMSKDERLALIDGLGKAKGRDQF